MSETENLLRRAEDALRSAALRLLAVQPWLDKPYADRPELTPWTNTMGPQARRVYELSQEIRKHLGLPHSYATRALGYPPLERTDVLRAAVVDLHMAGIKTGAEYEELVSELIAKVYEPRKGAQS